MAFLLGPAVFHRTMVIRNDTNRNVMINNNVIRPTHPWTATDLIHGAQNEVRIVLNDGANTYRV